MSHPAYKPPPVLCIKTKVAKGGGVFAGHYGTTIHGAMCLYNYVIFLVGGVPGTLPSVIIACTNSTGIHTYMNRINT